MKRICLVLLLCLALLTAGCAGTQSEVTPSPTLSPEATPVNQETPPPAESTPSPEASPGEESSPMASEEGVILLYFGNADATKVVPEAREIQIPKGISQADYIKLLVEELIKGPDNPDLSRTIPETAKVLEAYVLGSNAYVDFSEEMISAHSRGAAGEAMTVYSIVSTLTELEGIEGVMLTVVGQPMNIEHMVIDTPMERDESMIEQ
jgi:germination protein M